MKIVVLSSHTPSLYWFRNDMMKAFCEKGHTVYALGNEDEQKWASGFYEQGIKYKQIYVQRNGMNPLSDLKTLRSITKALKEIKPDKIFTYQAKTIIYGTIAANNLGITEVYPLIAGLGSVFLNDGLKTKVVRKILMTEYRYSMRKCPAVFFQNSDDLRVFQQMKVIKNQNVAMLHGSGVSLEKFSVQPMPENFAFICISRLIRDKGVYEYLEACKIVKEKNPRVRCLLVGPYDSNPSSLKPEELQPFIDDGVIEYFGEQSDVVPYLKQSSVFVLPSYREGTPKTVLEAMACGRPTITTNAPGCRETVEDRINGLLVPVKDVEQLTLAMQYMIDHPKELTEMAKNARSKAEQVFDVNKVNEKIIKTMKFYG